jgi:DNA-binding HxlR family transcriptional regulator
MDVTAPQFVSSDCRGVSEVLSRVGDKWTVQIVVALRGQPRRFNELKRQVGGVSQQMLTRTLKTLERDGLVQRTVYATTPPQVEYALTSLGVSLSEPVRALAQWARANLATLYDNRLSYDSSR